MAYNTQIEPPPETADRAHINIDSNLAQSLGSTLVTVPGAFVFQRHDKAAQVIGADGGDVVDPVKKRYEKGDALLGIGDGGLAIAAGAGVEAVADKQFSG